MSRWGVRPALALVGTLLFLGAVAGACGGTDPDVPPEISYGRDVCDECGMIISEARFAAAYRRPDGDVRKFDDVGDMVVYGRKTGELSRARPWVHDYRTRKWLDARKAWYVASDAVDTPMGRGVVAFAKKSSAEAFAKERRGAVLDWKDLLARPERPEQSGATPIPDSTRDHG